MKLSGADEVGEVASFYVDPAVWRSGVGRRLMDAALDGLAAAGFGHATLWVLDTNARAIAFYRALGFVPDGATQRDQVGGTELGEIRLRRALTRTPAVSGLS